MSGRILGTMLKKSTGEILKKLRLIMQDASVTGVEIKAYIIPAADSHNTEVVSPRHNRVAYVSGFTGNIATAVVTNEHACLWMDSKFYLQATRQVDENWTLLKFNTETNPDIGHWLTKSVPAGSNVGVDPRIMTYTKWNQLDSGMRLGRLQLIPIQHNLVDYIWTERPVQTAGPLEPISLEYSGKKIQQKLNEVRGEMRKKKCTILVVSALDEIAWILNVRGSDTTFNALFYAYLFVEEKSFILFVHGEKITEKVRKHLEDESRSRFFIAQYNNVYENLQQKSIIADGYVWCSGDTNYALTSMVSPDKLYIKASPIAIAKLVKTPSEFAGMKKAGLKDGASYCCTLDWAERNIAHGTVTETSICEKLEENRMKQSKYIGACYHPMSAFGFHSAAGYYVNDPNNDTVITDKEVYLLEASAHYMDGTSKIGRTVHFGNPNQEEKTAYTLVVKGFIALARAVFPGATKPSTVDTYARRFLWEQRMDFDHDVGHGIGCNLALFEDLISIGRESNPDSPGLSAGMFFSVGPGCYSEGKFGIRLTSVISTVVWETESHNDDLFLSFESYSRVPFQKKMMHLGMLSYGERKWLNEYHDACRKQLLPILKAMGNEDAIRWLMKETEHIAFGGEVTNVF